MKERTAAEIQLFKELSLVWDKDANPIIRTNTILALWVWINCISKESPLYARRHHLCAYLDRKSELQGPRFYKRLPAFMDQEVVQELLLKADAPKLSKLTECNTWNEIKESRKIFPDERGHVLKYVRAYYALVCDRSVKNDEKARRLYKHRLEEEQKKIGIKSRKEKGAHTKIKAYKAAWGRRLPFLWAANKAKLFIGSLPPSCPASLFSRTKEKRDGYEQKLRRFGAYLAWAIENTKKPGIEADEIVSWNLPPARPPKTSKVTNDEWEEIKIGSAGQA